MGAQASFDVASVEDATRVVEYFNGFHDGFMKRIVIESRDRMDEDHGQSCSGVFDVEIDFAHYNYWDGSEPFHPYNQIVHARFSEVQDLCLQTSVEYSGNTIIGFSIVPAIRPIGGAQGSEECLGLRFSRHFYLEEERRYELRETQLFTFRTATFAE